MALFSTLLALLVLSPAVQAQEAVDRDMIGRIRAEGLDRSQALAMFDHLTNGIGPRLTASPAYLEAAAWARDRLAGWGLSGTRLEPFTFGRGWTLEGLTLEMRSPRYFPLTGYPEAWTPSTRGIIDGVPVYIGDRTAEEIWAIREQLRDAIVLATAPQTSFIEADRPQPADTDERVRIGAPPGIRAPTPVPIQGLQSMLQQIGAAVLLRPNMGEHGTIFVLGNRNTTDDAIPQIVIMPEHYNMLVRMLQAGIRPVLRVEIAARYHEQDRNGYNVLAEIPGSDPQLRDEIVMVGAHLDSWHSSPGGTDNADGVVAVMEAVRILKSIGAQPWRTIRVALWGGEEQGLLGSRAWAEQNLAGEANAAVRERLSLYLNDDPGTGATYGFYAEESVEAMQIFDAWLAPLADLGVKRNVIDRIGSTDHLSFTRQGVPGFTTVKDYVDYDVRTHHTNVDFFERVSETDLKQSAIVLATFLWHAATREGRFPRPPST
ncbi:MAG: M20/M25/M40 family metallo-hydrolase [Gemmatimonadetes bacterium]|nr:M20/M25/M40 family metallo-hydrolase [Gemmatimonadota bacterium]